ncbi:DUF2273 domain-containing protein [bacterium]|nr:DUF2273 domain-containing protein [bacterium]MBU0899821.1 DUF2273 domain-containing protein [bacterium]MBU1152369.1 DUF2273 domain-containing protein [bacterium]MBU1782326.1 DUF2273 domain-containing protein [bacterium]MBU2599838.1 DUF2273 domain-containing protein [bacterium]
MNNKLLERIKTLINKYPERFMGAALGLIAGLTIIIFGALKTFIILFCILVGFFIGKLREM